MQVLVAPYLHTSVLSVFENFSPSNKWIVVCDFGFICSSLLNNVAEHFVCVYLPPYIFLVKCLFKAFAHFLQEASLFSSSRFESALYSLEGSPLSDR